MRGPEISLAWLTPGEEGALTTIEARGADQEARGEIAVEDLSFTIRPGTVTGFLGPDVAGNDDERGPPEVGVVKPDQAGCVVVVSSTTPRTPRPSGRSPSAGR
jgi:ABC-2 type transport system ATP-binding protein